MKVGFLGFGRVATTVAYTLLMNSDTSILLYDIAVERCKGEISDLTHAFPEVELDFVDLPNLLESDVLVISAGKSRTSDKKRVDLFQENLKIMKTFLPFLRHYDGFILVVTNPVDALTTILAREIGRERVLGFGSLLDTMRYRKISGRDDVWVIGEHGEHFVPIGGSDEIVESIRSENLFVIEKKGGTQFGPAKHISDTILGLDNILTVGSVLLNGEYGLSDLAIGVPVQIKGRRVVKVLEWNMNEWERKRFFEGAESLRNL
ncbi:MAG: malate dehydrogenase, partial [Candidatus Asgardarchaeia archaeon]